MDAELHNRVGVSPSTGAIGLMRHSNRVKRSILNPDPLLALYQEGGRFDRIVKALAYRVPASRELHNFVARELAPFYTQSNANLQKLRPELDLTNYP